MSHFVVLVIGDDLEGQLAPYDENIETAPRSDGEVSENDKQRFLDYYKEKAKAKGTFEEVYKEHGETWNGNSWKLHNGIWEEFTTYNPDSKWDWYQVGGRWTGYFKLKAGAVAELGSPGVFGHKAESGKGDSVEKGYIDFEGESNDARENAIKHYRLIASIFKNGIPKVERSWSSLWDDKSFKDKEERVAFYDAQTGVKELAEIKAKGKLTQKQKDAMGWRFTLDDYQCTEEEFGERASNKAGVPYSFVKDGIWYEKGQMGWWGMSDDKYTDDEWNKRFKEMLNELDDDVLITAVDCHI